MPDIFDRIEVISPGEDIFDRMDLMDRVELPMEEKVMYSSEMGKLIREQIHKEIKNMPIGQIISQVMGKEASKKELFNGEIKEIVDKEIKSLKDENKRLSELLEEKLKEQSEKTKLKYDDLWNTLNSQPWYQFGGFPIGGASGGSNPLYIGPVATATWRFSYTEPDSDLIVEHLDTGVWTEKARFNIV